MADFESCYFCGEGPREVREYDVVPGAFDPTPDQQRSVALCPDCREKLTLVLEAAVDASAASGAGNATVGPDDGTGTAGEHDDTGAAAGTDGEQTAGAESAPDRTGLAAASEAGETATDDDPDTVDRSAALESDRPAAAERAEAARRPDTAAVDDDEDEDLVRTQGTGVSFNTAAAGDDDVEGSDGATDETPQRETGAASVDTETSADLMDSGTEAYRQVIRLLQNREFPVQRDEIAEVAVSAYELSPSETQSAIDAIVNKGLLVEENGVLRRSPSGE